jgi:APA family basic amino acid/polyamine antiporter
MAIQGDEGFVRSIGLFDSIYNPATATYGNLYGSLLDYVVSAALVFYIATIAGVFRLRRTRPDAPRPYRAFGYPVVPAFYVVAALLILGVLFVYRASTTWPGMAIVAFGVPVYAVAAHLASRGRRAAARPASQPDAQSASPASGPVA